MSSESTTTQLLADARMGDRAALDRLMPRLYDELRLLAQARLRQHRPGETLNTTALVHEVYLKLIAGETPPVENRRHFFALAAQAMRFVLISYARERTALKRGGPEFDLPLLAAAEVAGSEAPEDEALDLLALDAALDRLAANSVRMAELVELRFFGGLSHEEIAEVTGRSHSTVKRDWRRARAYLHHAVRDTPHDAVPPGGTSVDDPLKGDAANEG